MAETPYRTAGTRDEYDDSNPLLDWIATGALDIVERCKVMTAENADQARWIAELQDSLTAAQYEVQAKQALALREAQTKSVLVDENDRLKTELVLVGPMASEEEITLLRRQLADITGQCQVLKCQVKALSSALRQERLQREHIQALDGERFVSTDGSDDRDVRKMTGKKPKVVIDAEGTG